MFRSYDLVTLGLVTPLLALTLLPAWRDRPAAELLRVSMLAFSVYNYAYYLFGAQLNAVLLIHVAIFTASLNALALSLVAVDVGRLAARFRPRTPVHIVAMILLLLGLPLATFQLSGLVGYALTGTLPRRALPAGAHRHIHPPRRRARPIAARPGLPARGRVAVAPAALGLPAGRCRPAGQRPPPGQLHRRHAVPADRRHPRRSIRPLRADHHHPVRDRWRSAAHRPAPHQAGNPAAPVDQTPALTRR
jgi:hypothetical protein